MRKANRDLRDARAILNVEADRRLVETARRSDSAVARATVVAGAAVIVGGLQIVGWHGWLDVIVVALAFVAAVLAVIVLTFRPGKEMPVRAFSNSIKLYTPVVLAKQVLELKLRMISHDEARIGRQARFLLASYISLGVGIAATLIAAITKL